MYNYQNNNDEEIIINALFSLEKFLLYKESHNKQLQSVKDNIHKAIVKICLWSLYNDTQMKQWQRQTELWSTKCDQKMSFETNSTYFLEVQMPHPRLIIVIDDFDPHPRVDCCLTSSHDLQK
jgi:hypothetical protein